MELNIILIWSAIVFSGCFNVGMLLSNRSEINKFYENVVKTVNAINTRVNKKDQEMKEAENKISYLYDENALLRKKLELLEEIQTHLSAKKPEKQETKKRDQKERALKLIVEALTYAPHTFAELVMLLDENNVPLKKGTISVYLSNDKRFESKDGKWQIKKLDESPSVS